MKITIAGILITLPLICMGCTPQASLPTETQTNETPNAVQERRSTSNVALTLTYDESESLPTADEITILVDSKIIESEAVDSIFKFHLDPGSYDIQISSVNRSAARGRLTVPENTLIEPSFTLKTEAWALLGDYDLRLTGLSENQVLDMNSGIQFGVYDEAGKLLPFDHISLIIVYRIEAGSFVEDGGGYTIGRGQLIQDMFSIKDLTAKMADTADTVDLLQNLEPGDYSIEMDIFDSVNNKSYHDVGLFRVAGQPPTQNTP